ncbi:LptF/LptG family permease [Polaribacter sp. Z014]|uniref:LptF/LptG family permease n=1 Tax=unclassified Polaribacter TaxID=196858 RepID=UPI00193BEE95|nr:MULTISPECIES: LptF/LptG family permease [unclassified Polaribacter]MCL7765162.1 LptF/LptG family permease [Polaribacter sp. Z014]QVY67086.1 LptF/LptG family permease [Polaribacter sp. Q13]
MKIIDWYILKRFLVTFLFTLLILIPIAIAIDISEKIDNFLEHKDLGFYQIVDEYYKNFIIYYANTFMPLALFIAVILFTSKLSNNTEIIAITNAKVSFTRLLYPYFVGATLITVVSLGMNHFVVPNSSKERKKFEREYVHSSRRNHELKYVKEFSLQLTDSTYIFIRSFDTESNAGYDFTSEVYDGIKMKSKLVSDRISYSKKDSTFILSNWRMRKIFKDRDSIFSGTKIDTVFNFTPKDLIYKSALAQEMPSNELLKFINVSKKRGVKNLNAYLVEFYKRTSLPIASYILTIIAVALAFRKRRGGTGVNLALGIGIMFLYVFIMKIAEVLGAVAGVNSLLYVWLPNIVFGCLAIYLYFYARK